MVFLTILFGGAWLCRKMVFDFVFQQAKVNFESLLKHAPPEVKFFQRGLDLASRLASLLSYGKLRQIEKEIDGGGNGGGGGGGAFPPFPLPSGRRALRGHRLPPDSGPVVDMEETSPGFWEAPGGKRGGAAPGPVVHAPWETGGRAAGEGGAAAPGGEAPAPGAAFSGAGASADAPPLPEGSVLVREGDGWREFIAPDGTLCRDERTPEGCWVRAIAVPAPPSAPPPAGIDGAGEAVGAPPGQAGAPAAGKGVPGAAAGVHTGGNTPARGGIEALLLGAADSKPAAAEQGGAGAQPPKAALHPRTLEMARGPSGAWEYVGERRSPPAAGAPKGNSPPVEEIPLADKRGKGPPAPAARPGLAGHSALSGARGGGIPGAFAADTAGAGGLRSQEMPAAPGIGGSQSQGAPAAPGAGAPAPPVQRGEGRAAGAARPPTGGSLGAADEGEFAGRHSLPPAAGKPSGGEGQPVARAGGERPAPPPAAAPPPERAPGAPPPGGRLAVDGAPTAGEALAGGPPGAGSVRAPGGTGKADAGERAHGAAPHGRPVAGAGERPLDAALMADSYSGIGGPQSGDDSAPGGGRGGDV